MNPNKALWEKGDFTRIAATMRESGDTLVASLDVAPGMHVLDVGCGDGTTALPSARRGAHVLGVDIASNLVAAGNARATAASLANVRFQEGDACDLKDVPDASQDLVVSIFGAMFAPKPFDVAKALVRVAKPVARIVMGNWIPGDPTLVAQILKISSAYTPPPPEGFVSPMLWGQEEHVRQRFSEAGVPLANVHCAKDTFTFDFAGSPAGFVSEFRQWYGPTMNAFAAAEANGKAAELQRELETLFAEQNRSGSTNRTVVDATFLRVTVTT